MGNSNKRKQTKGCVVGLISLLLTVALAGCAKESTDNDAVEVANVQTEETSEELVTPEPTPTEEPVATEAPIETSEPEPTPEQTGGSIVENTTNPDKETDNTEKVTPEPTEEPLVDNKEEPLVDNTETTNPSSSVTSSANFGTPQEYYGDPDGRGPGRIIVKGFDYNDFADGLSWEGEYWTASNGVEIKILSVEGRSTGMMPVPDGKGKDNEPNSPFQMALAEALGWDYSKVAADLNVSIPLATYKRTEIDINDADLVAYRNAYDYKLWSNKGVAEYYKPYEYGEQVNLRFAVASDGISEFDSVGGILWSVIRVSDYWQVEINADLPELRWDGIHQVLRYLSPDGDALYDVIYEDYYVGSPAILEYYEWFAVGNSQIYQEDPATGYVIYRFK